MARTQRELRERGLVRLPDAREVGEAAVSVGVAELTSHGLALVARDAGLTVAEGARLLGLSGGGPEQPLGSRRKLFRELAHTRGADELFVGLYEVAEAWRRLGRDHAVVQWLPAAACAWGWMRPDGYGIYRCEGELYGFYLEYDRGTEGTKDYQKKFRAYIELRASGRYERDLIGFPTILVVADGPTKAAQVRSELRLVNEVLTACAGVASVPVLFTTRYRIRADPDGMLGPIWRTVLGEERRIWFAGERASAMLRHARRPPSQRKGFRAPYGFSTHRCG